MTTETECELVQMSISDAVDSNKNITQAEQQHISTCPDCQAFQSMWQPQSDSTIHHIASGTLLDKNSLSKPIISSLNREQHSINGPKIISKGKFLNTGKLLKVSAVAAAIAVLTTLVFFSSPDEENIAQNHSFEKPQSLEAVDVLHIKLQDIEIKLTQEDIQNSLEKNYTKLSETAYDQWKSTTSNLSRATEFISTEAFSLPKKYLSPPNDQTLNPKEGHTRLAHLLIS